MVTAEHLIKAVRSLPDRQVPNPPHLVLQVHQRTPQTRRFRTQPNPKVAFPIARAVQRQRPARNVSASLSQKGT
jgi:hypothetical protein